MSPRSLCALTLHFAWVLCACDAGAFDMRSSAELSDAATDGALPSQERDNIGAGGAGGARALGPADAGRRDEPSMTTTMTAAMQTAAMNEMNDTSDVRDMSDMDGGMPGMGCPVQCAAPHARGMCKDGACVLRCEAGYADCDGDIERAESGDGCETSVNEDVRHCGACGQSCPAPEDGLAQCVAASCEKVSLTHAAGESLPPHGTPIDNVTTQLCPAGSVLTGLEGFVVDNLIADSMRIVCSPITLAAAAGGPTVSVGKAVAPFGDYVGGNNREGTAANPVPVPYKLSCPVGTVVKQLRFTVWAHWGDENGHTYDTLKDFAIRCAPPSIADGQLSFGPLTELFTTSATQQTSDATRDETDTCGDHEAFLGFIIGYGANIDQITTECDSVSVTTSADAAP